MDLVNIVKY